MGQIYHVERKIALSGHIVDKYCLGKPVLNWTNYKYYEDVSKNLVLLLSNKDWHCCSFCSLFLFTPKWFHEQIISLQRIDDIFIN